MKPKTLEIITHERTECSPGEWFQHDTEFPKPMKVTDTEGKTWENSDAYICAERAGEKTLIALVKYSTARSGFGTVDNFEEAKANARLIQNAKKLFNILDHGLDVLNEQLTEDAHENPDIRDFMEDARLLLDKILD